MKSYCKNCPEEPKNSPAVYYLIIIMDYYSVTGFIFLQPLYNHYKSDHKQ